MDSVSDWICRNCSDLDLSATFRGTVKEGHKSYDPYIAVRKSDPFSEWRWTKEDRNPSCGFCKYLKTCWRLVEPEGDPGPGNTAVSKYESYGNSLIIDEIVRIGEIIEAVKSVRTEDGEHAELKCIPVLSPSLGVESLEHLKVAMERCNNDHSCMLAHGSMSISTPYSLRLIDCQSRQVVTAPALEEYSYIALSYVWGGMEPPQVHLTESLQSIPRTIDDAIKVTLSLNFKYLWVDMYCIPQGNAQEREIQIRQMDMIYRRASVTIVAAAGRSPSYGLPGVSLPRKIQQATFNLGGVNVINESLSFGTMVQRSSWSSRGWTFQESVFSRRLIIFTEQHINFECSSQPQEPVRDLYATSRDFFWHSVSPTWTSEQRHLERGAHYELIQRYSERTLSWPQDILAAFSGITNAFESLSSDLGSYWGIPVFWTGAGGPLTSFSVALSWEFAGTRSVSRREGFPSWSWVGWIGPIVYRSWAGPMTYGFEKTSRDIDRYLPPPDLCIEVELNDGSLIALEDVRYTFSDSQKRLARSRFLRIQAWTIPITLRMERHEEFRGQDVHAATVTVGYGYGKDLSAQANIDGHTMNRVRNTGYVGSHNCIGIPMGEFEDDYRWWWEHPVLIFLDKGSFWERVGFFHLRAHQEEGADNEYSKQGDFTEWRKNNVKLERRQLRLG